MKPTPPGYTLIELLVVVAMVSVLISITVVYSMNTAADRLAEADFQEHYLKAKNILLHAQSLYVQGFRSATDLNIEQLQTATDGSNWEVFANEISEITDGHAVDDFKIRISNADIQVKFFIADDIVLNGYPVQRQRVADGKDEIILTKVMHPARSRILKFNDYLAN